MIRESEIELENKFRISINTADLWEELKKLVLDAVEYQFPNVNETYWDWDGDKLMIFGTYTQEVKAKEFSATEYEPSEIIYMNEAEISEGILKDFLKDNFHKISGNISIYVEEERA